MTTDQQFDEINRKLDLLVKLLAYQLVSGKTLSHGAPILRRLGLSSPEIASVFDTTSNTVNVRLAEAKKASKNKQGK